jgi:hypothetical protein
MKMAMFTLLFSSSRWGIIDLPPPVKASTACPKKILLSCTTHAGGALICAVVQFCFGEKHDR